MKKTYIFLNIINMLGPLGGKVNTRWIPQLDMESIFTKIIYEISWSWGTFM